MSKHRNLRDARLSKLASGPAIAEPNDDHALVEADQRFQAALDRAITAGRERVEAVEATVDVKRRRAKPKPGMVP